MKVQELLEMYNSQAYKMLKPEQLCGKLKKDLEVKDYLTLHEKKALISRIIDKSIRYESSIYKFDEIEKYVYLVMYSIEAYTNIELSENVENDYDELYKNGLLNIIVNAFNDEYQSVSMLLNMKCGYILEDNKLEAKIGSFLETVSDNMDVLSAALSEKVKEMKLDMSNIDMNAVKSFLERIK